MKQTKVASTYGINGSVALKPEHREFVVIEGTKGSGQQAQEQAPERLSTKNLILSYVVLVAFVAVLAAVSAFVDVSVSNRLEASLDSVPAVAVYVAPGDSVWSLAEEHPINGYSTSDVARWIEEKNDLSTATLLPGQELLVPSSEAL